MGNVHEVMQTDPVRSKRGAAIAVREGHEGSFPGEEPSYVQWRRAERRVGTVELGVGGLHLCIQTGGKHGYGDEFRAWLSACAPFLHDARFYVQDEAANYVEAFELRDGRLTRQRVEAADSHIGLHLLQARPEHADFALDTLAEFLDETISFEGDDATSVCARAIAALITRAPQRWDGWFHRGGWLLALERSGEAVEALERAVTLAPPAERARAEVRLVRAVTQIDPKRALALGRADRLPWLEAASSAGGLFNEVATGLEALAELEITHGDPAAAPRLWLAALRASDDGHLSRHLSTIAGLRVAEGRLAEARDWLRAAVLIEPELADEVPTDRDYLPLRSEGLARLLDLDRDLDE